MMIYPLFYTEGPLQPSLNYHSGYSLPGGVLLQLNGVINPAAMLL